MRVKHKSNKIKRGHVQNIEMQTKIVRVICSFVQKSNGLKRACSVFYNRFQIMVYVVINYC